MDPVGKPKHYFAGGFECGEIVDALRERWQASGLDAHRLASAFEYLFRCGSKDNARQDAEKAINYLHRALYGTWFPFELRRQREAGAAEDVESVSVLDVLLENATLRSRVKALTAEVEGLKSSERERLIAQVVKRHAWLPDDRLESMNDYCHSRDLILHERARLRAQESK